MSVEGVWMYKVMGPRKRRYIAKLNSSDKEKILELAEKHSTPGTSLYLDFDGWTVRDARSYSTLFGIVIACDNYLDICGRCNVIGQFVRTALCCPECDELIGGV